LLFSAQRLLRCREDYYSQGQGPYLLRRGPGVL
jgi:hypothetical protein